MAIFAETFIEDIHKKYVEIYYFANYLFTLFDRYAIYKQ